ncbi:hypothetical protein HYPSUDRAFT_72065 [Hypholoma sublateritium FD-334 SS-4]|uniref:Uncharacterized protein n=1 Tax=Hypholoma sublateritium (strain FD-334 SS-4) TaxID=945553 RepID=A0A0D2KL93_HYPSF|nr:hypothetical protein HYPSUDRAFT_72065 [Hypholoma sublateritium FD-334 SS-4]
MSETGPGPAQGHHSFPPQSHIASHQQFVNQQPQQHNLVPIQLGLNIPGDHHPVRRQEHSGELAYPEPSAAGVSFFNAHGQHPQPGRGSESTTQEYHDEYQSHDPYRQHQAQHRQQQGFPDPNESQMAAAVHMHYAGHRPRTEFQMERAHLEESPASYPSRRTVSSTNSNRGGSPITPASAATSESEMLLYHYTATGGAPSCLDPDMHEMQPAGATTSLASVASVHSQPLGTQRPSPGGGEMHPNHTGVDVEDESRLGDIGAVQQRGNGHGGLSSGRSWLWE